MTVPLELESPYQEVLLTATGGDRATAYLMSNKIVRRGDRIIASWLDVNRQNHYAEVDTRTGKVVRAGTVGKQLTDNHCGAAMTTGSDGTLYLMTGAHGGPFELFEMGPGKAEWNPANDGDSIGNNGTYPSLVCDIHDNLHLTYRRENRSHHPTIMYTRCLKGQKWESPQELVVIAIPEHTWTTHSLESGPEGTLHLVFSNVLPFPAGTTDGRYYGGSHLYSEDAGTTWRQYGIDRRLTLPIAAQTLQRIEGESMDDSRADETFRGPRSPMNPYYHRVMLSNVAVDRRGRPVVVVHNILNGTATLYRHVESGWHGRELDSLIEENFPGYKIRHSSQVALDRDDNVEVALTVAKESDLGWGGATSEIVRLRLNRELQEISVQKVMDSGDDDQHWLPILERRSYNTRRHHPALLFTRGANAGGHDHNVNSIETEVWLQFPSSTAVER